jgi:TonB family protein
VPGVLILLKNNTSHQEAARANSSGEYAFSGLPAGSYTLEVRAPGFAEFRKAIVLPADRTNIMLDIGSVTETVEVVGKAAHAQETAAPRQIRVGGNVQATKLLSMIKPEYPAGAEAAGIEGTVLLRAVISTGGDLLGLSVLSQSVDGQRIDNGSGRELADAAMDAVKQWHYQPTLLNGDPVEVVTTIAVTFRLER